MHSLSLSFVIGACALMLGSNVSAANPVAVPNPGQAHEHALIRAADLEVDADVLYDAFKTPHPGIYRYTTPAQFDDRYRELKASLANGATLGQAFLAFTRFAVAIRCGHTWTNPLNQPPRVAAPLLEKADRLPLHFTVVGRRFLVTEAIAGIGVQRGDEIVAIDDVPIGDVIATLWPYLRADGSSDGKRLAQIGHDAGESAFDLYYPLISPSTADSRRLRLRALGTAKRRTVDVPLVPETKREQAFKQDAQTSPDAWTYSTDGDVATINMPTWAFWNSHFDWKGWLDKTFADIHARKIRFLVIDLRNNEGGDGAIGEWLEQRLATASRDYASHVPVLVYDVVPDRLRPYLSTWDKDFYDQRPRIEALAQGTFMLKDREPEVAHIDPANEPFKGKTFVLVGPTDSSATFEFARIVQETGLATLVGQPTGGNLRGINGGNMFFLTLPRTGITIDVPLIAWTSRQQQPDSPVLPDVRVAPDLPALARGKDPEMRRVRELIRESAGR